jgi:hypothetical protein
MENPSISDPGIEQTESQPSAGAPLTAQQVQINDSETASGYANFCRISGTPEELLIDFGLNPQPMGTPQQPIVVSQRIVTNWYTAKRLLNVLQMTVARHEAVFGVLETDIQRRINRLPA